MRITIKQYAELRGVSAQAITHILRKNRERQEPLHTGLSGVNKVYKLGRSYELDFNGFWDYTNIKKPKLKPNKPLPLNHDYKAARQVI
jgi:ferritin-like protein